MNNIAIVVQRYGTTINGGAEYHAKCIAELLSKNHKITVLTTKASDYNGWKNTITKDEEIINNVKVKRFKTEQQFSHLFKKLRRKLLFENWYHRIFKQLNIFNFFKKNTSFFSVTKNEASTFLKAQGPYCPALIDYITKEASVFDCFIFLTYLYFPTVKGLEKVGAKSIFIPTAHDEALLFSKPYEYLFALPKIIFFNTKAEQNLVLQHFKNTVKKQSIVGLGIDNHTVKIDNVNLKYDFNFEYFIYIGRVEKQKGCDLMIEYFLKSTIDNAIKLVLVGNFDHYKKYQNSKKIVFTGFVNKDEKFWLLKKSIALIMPSPYESLSLVTLESMLQKKLVIANKSCEVLHDHIKDSEAGYLFDDAKSFNKNLHAVINLNPKNYKEKASNGLKYVQQNYAWDVIEAKFENAIQSVVNG